MEHLRFDLDDADDLFSCDDVRLAWLGAELADECARRASQAVGFAALWLDR